LDGKQLPQLLGELPYYASGTALSKLGIGTSGYVLESNGSAPTWVAQSTLSVGSATNATNTAITDNTSSSSTWYPTIVSATTGNLPQTTSSTKLSFVPSTGILTATGFSGAHNGTVGATTANTGAFTTLSASTSIQNATWTTSGRPTGSTGLIGFNTSFNGLEIYNGSAWDAITGGPAFSATYSASTTSTTSTFTKLALASSIFDTNSNYSTSTSTFTPTVAGYYQLTGWVDLAITGTATTAIISIYKNGSEYIRGTRLGITSNGGLGVSGLVYANGSTDYFNIYIFQNSGANGSTGGNCWFQGAMVRSA